MRIMFLPDDHSDNDWVDDRYSIYYASTWINVWNICFYCTCTVICISWWLI